MVNSLSATTFGGEVFALCPTSAGDNRPTVYIVTALQTGQIGHVKYVPQGLITLQSKAQIFDLDIVLDAVF